jgi:hypothetical protein
MIARSEQLPTSASNARSPRTRKDSSLEDAVVQPNPTQPSLLEDPIRDRYLILCSSARRYARSRCRRTTLADDVAHEAAQEWAMASLRGHAPRAPRRWIERVIRARLGERADDEARLERLWSAGREESAGCCFLAVEHLDAVVPVDPGWLRERLVALLDLELVTERQEEVVRALLDLGSYKAVARRLGITVQYVKLVCGAVARTLHDFVERSEAHVGTPLPTP